MLAHGRQRGLDDEEIRARRAHVFAQMTPERARTRLAQAQPQHMSDDVMPRCATA